METALSFGPSDNRARRKSFTSYPAFQRKKVPFREISHFNSIKFSKLKLRVGPSERQRFYTARNGDSAVFFPKTKTMSSQPNQLNPHPWIENKTLSLKHNYTIKFLTNGLTKTLIFLEWKHKPQRERDGETETEERNKDQLHKPFSCFSLPKAGEAAGPLRHLHVRILFILFFKNPRVVVRKKINQAATGEFVQDMKWVTHGSQAPGRRHAQRGKIRCGKVQVVRAVVGLWGNNADFEHETQRTCYYDTENN